MEDNVGESDADVESSNHFGVHLPESEADSKL
jgi:hypothetical protein